MARWLDFAPGLGTGRGQLPVNSGVNGTSPSLLSVKLKLIVLLSVVSEHSSLSVVLFLCVVASILRCGDRVSLCVLFERRAASG